MTNKKPDPDRRAPRRTVTFTLPQPLLDRLREEALAERRSVSAQLALLLELRYGHE